MNEENSLFGDSVLGCLVAGEVVLELERPLLGVVGRDDGLEGDDSLTGDNNDATFIGLELDRSSLFDINMIEGFSLC